MPHTKGFLASLMITALTIAGWLCIFLGVIIPASGVLWLRPKVSDLEAQLNKELETLDSYINQENRSLLVDIGRQGGVIIQLTPTLTAAAEGTLQEAASLLDSTGNAVEESTKGFTGLFEPKKSVKVDIKYMRNTAIQLRLLAGALAPLKGALTEIGRDLSLFSQRNDLSKFATITQEQIHGRIQSVSVALANSTISNATTLLAFALGGVCLILGLFSFCLGLICRRVFEMNPAVKQPESLDAKAA